MLYETNNNTFLDNQETRRQHLGKLMRIGWPKSYYSYFHHLSVEKRNSFIFYGENRILTFLMEVNRLENIKKSFKNLIDTNNTNNTNNTNYTFNMSTILCFLFLYFSLISSLKIGHNSHSHLSSWSPASQHKYHIQF